MGGEGGGQLNLEGQTDSHPLIYHLYTSTEGCCPDP